MIGRFRRARPGSVAPDVDVVGLYRNQQRRYLRALVAFLAVVAVALAGFAFKVALLQRQNNTLLKQVTGDGTTIKADDATIKADDALIVTATSPAAARAAQDATASAIGSIIRCVNNHIDVVMHLAPPLSDCAKAVAAGIPTTPPPVAAVPVPAPHSSPAGPVPSSTVKPGAVRVAPRAAAPAPSAGCAAAVAYLSVHAAPGFDFTCAPNAQTTPGCPKPPPHIRAVGCTVAIGTPNGGVVGHIYIDSTCAVFIAYANEASNSLRFAGLSNAPLDPFGVAEC